MHQAVVDVDDLLAEDGGRLLNAKLSSVAVTDPSSEFSFATTPNSHLPRSTASNTSSNDAHSRSAGSSMPRRAANARAASSV